MTADRPHQDTRKRSSLNNDQVICKHHVQIGSFFRNQKAEPKLINHLQRQCRKLPGQTLRKICPCRRLVCTWCAVVCKKTTILGPLMLHKMMHQFLWRRQPRSAPWSRLRSCPDVIFPRTLPPLEDPSLRFLPSKRLPTFLDPSFTCSPSNFIAILLSPILPH